MHQTKPHLSVEERHKLLIAALEKDGGLERLKMWSPKLAARATRLLLEYHDIFSLEPHEIGMYGHHAARYRAARS